MYGIYTVQANRVGYEDGILFGGKSEIINPRAERIAGASADKEELLLAELDDEEIRRARIVSPLLGDEKLDLVHRELGRIRSRKFQLDDLE